MLENVNSKSKYGCIMNKEIDVADAQTMEERYSHQKFEVCKVYDVLKAAGTIDTESAEEASYSQKPPMTRQEYILYLQGKDYQKPSNPTRMELFLRTPEGEDAQRKHDCRIPANNWPKKSGVRVKRIKFGYKGIAAAVIILSMGVVSVSYLIQDNAKEQNSKKANASVNTPSIQHIQKNIPAIKDAGVAAILQNSIDTTAPKEITVPAFEASVQSAETDRVLPSATPVISEKHQDKPEAKSTVRLEADKKQAVDKEDRQAPENMISNIPPKSNEAALAKKTVNAVTTPSTEQGNKIVVLDGSDPESSTPPIETPIMIIKTDEADTTPKPTQSLLSDLPTITDIIAEKEVLDASLPTDENIDTELNPVLPVIKETEAKGTPVIQQPVIPLWDTEIETDEDVETQEVDGEAEEDYDNFVFHDIKGLFIPEETAAPVQTKGDNAVEYAKKRLGSKYVLGASGRGKTFDCSSLVRYAYDKAGIDLPRTSVAQASYVRRRHMLISKGDLQPGDLIFWGKKDCDCGRYKEIHHVGIYIGDGKTIEASANKGKVVINRLWGANGKKWKQVMFARPYKS